MNLRQRIRSSEFIINTGTLIGGTGLAQVLPLVFAPLISRLYGPEDFSVYGVFVAIYSITGVVITLRYDSAIMLPKDDERAKAIVALCLFNAFVLSIVSLIVILLFRSFIGSLFPVGTVTSWLLLVPLAAFLLSINTVLITWYNRTKKYKVIATNRIARNSILTASNIGLGAAKAGHIGLIVSQIISDGIASIYYLTVFYRKALSKTFRFQFKDLKSVAAEYIKFPKFILPATFVDAVSAQLPILLIATLYSQELSGSYFFAWRLLAIPVSIIGAAYAQTFYQKFVEAVNMSNYTYALDFLKKSWLLLAAIITIPGVLVMIWGVPLFAIVFGNDWAESGKIATLLVVYVMFAFVSSPTSTSYIALGMQKYNLFFSLSVFIYRFASIYTGYLLGDFYLGLLILVLFESVEIVLYNTFALIKLRKLAKSKNEKTPLR